MAAAKTPAQRNAAASKTAASLLGGNKAASSGVSWGGWAKGGALRNGNSNQPGPNVGSTAPGKGGVTGWGGWANGGALKGNAAPKSGGSNAKPPPTTAPAAKPGSSSAAPTPFLTPAQQAAFTAAATKYGFDVARINHALEDAKTKLTLGQSALNRQHVVSTDNENQALAARGLFQSSIRAGDLNDLDATFAMRNNILTTNYANAVLNDNNQLGALGSDWTATQNYYHELAVQNAQGITPNVPAGPPAPPPSKPNQSTTGGKGTGPMGSPGGPTTGQIAQAGASQTAAGNAALNPTPKTPAQLGAQQTSVNHALLNPKPKSTPNNRPGLGWGGWANGGAMGRGVGIIGGIG